MFRGYNNQAVDAKGRLSVPARYRERLVSLCDNQLVLTVNPWDRCVLLYPAPQWDITEARLLQLPDTEKLSRRTKQVMCGFATECQVDGHGRVLLPPEHREYAKLEREVVVLGQTNRCEIWNKVTWESVIDERLWQAERPAGELSEKLRELAL